MITIQQNETMKVSSIVSIAILSVWSLAIFISLILYANQEITKDVYVITVDSGQTYTDHIGNLIVAQNTLYMVCMLLTVLLIILDDRNHPEERMMESFFSWCFICSFLSEYIIGLYVFVAVCSHTGCFEYQTPLYILLLIHIFVIFVVLCLTLMQVFWCCESAPTLTVQQNPPEAKQQEMKNIELVHPPGQLTYETILKIHQFDMTHKCVICSVDLSTNDGMKILKCGHYYHKICVEEWEKRANTCPVCNMIIEKN